MPALARTPRDKLKQEDLRCLKVIRGVTDLRPLLKEPQQHGNVKLELFDALIVLLAAFFNPTVRSLRLIEQLSQMPWVQTPSDVQRVCRSTLSDAFERFRPENLCPLIEALMEQVPRLRRIDEDLEQVCRRVIAADGSMFNLAADVVWALHQSKSNGAAYARCRLDLQIDIDSFTPVDLSVSGSDQGSEAAAFIGRLAPGVVYLVDRNFLHFGFLNAVLDKGSDFVLRLRESTNFQPTESRPLSARDVEAGLLSDRVGILPGSPGGRTGPPPARTVREVICQDPATGKQIRLLTSLLDVPGHVIGLLYRHRWQVELFLRWLKVWAGMEHLISHGKKGITLQFYVAVIACLLMHISTGRKVNKYMLFLMGQVASGLATFEQIVPLLEKIEHEKELERRRRQKKKLLKNQELLPG